MLRIGTIRGHKVTSNVAKFDLLLVCSINYVYIYSLSKIKTRHSYTSIAGQTDRPNGLTFFEGTHWYHVVNTG